MKGNSSWSDWQNIDGLDTQPALDFPPMTVMGDQWSVGRAACAGCGAPLDCRRFCQRVRTSILDIYGVDDAANVERARL